MHVESLHSQTRIQSQPTHILETQPAVADNAAAADNASLVTVADKTHPLTRYQAPIRSSPAHTIACGSHLIFVVRSQRSQ